MLVAKINPPAKRVIQTSPFATDEFTAEYMVVKCTDLVIGGSSNSPTDEIKFNIKFGNLGHIKNPDGSVGRSKLDEILFTTITLTQQELSDWGTDDSIVFNKIAQKLGFSVISIQSIEDMPFTY